jgi:translation initiation factor 1
MKQDKAEHPGGLVYSTEYGRMCPACGKPAAECLCAQIEAAPTGDGIVHIVYETKGRKGKGVTVVSGLLMTPSQLKTLARELKAKCGSGGTVKDFNIEIQGDHRDRLAADLKAKGHSVKCRK